MKILIIDFNDHEASSLKYLLEQDSYTVDVTSYTKFTLEKLSTSDYNLVLLNIIHNKKDSIKYCQSIRKISMVPIIVMSDESDTMKIILAFDYGADDFVSKPYNDLEIKARIKALLRRQSYYNNKISKNTEIQRGCIKINTLGRKVFINDETINLTSKEFDLFVTLLSNPGKVYKREHLLEKVWGYSYFGDLRTVDVHIRRIREKLEKILPDDNVISTKWGQGYFFNESFK